MFKNGEIIELTIDKLVFGGEGVGKCNGVTVFVSDVIAGESVKAEITQVKKNYLKASLHEVLVPSEHRVKPFCPYVRACGGCQWQHIDYDEQIKNKKQIVEECINRIAKIEAPVKDVIRSEQTKEYRCKVQYPVRQTKVSQRLLAGYYRKGTHEVVNVKYCPVQPAIIDDITEFLRKKVTELNITAYNEQTKKGIIKHFVFRYSATNKNLLVTLVINAKKPPAPIFNLCKELVSTYPEIVGAVVNFNTMHSNVILGEKSKLIAGIGYVEEVLLDKTFKVSSDSFFQVNPPVAEKMIKEIKNIIEERTENPTILDVYAGSAGFSLALSDSSDQVTAVESSETAVSDGLENIEKNNVENVSYLKGNADKILWELAEEKKSYDVTILDPPRKGCSQKVLEAVKDLTKQYLLYISCNPSTLARDAKLLADDFTLEFVQPIDMFSHTYHVESIAVFKKK